MLEVDRIPLGEEVHAPTGTHTGRVVAVFLNRRAAMKWGAYDQEFWFRGRPSDDCVCVVVHSSDGDLLLPVDAVRPGRPRSCPAPVIDPELVRRDDPPSETLRPPAPRPQRKSAARRRKPVIGVGG